MEFMGDSTRNMIFRMRLHKGMAGIHTELFNGSGDTKLSVKSFIGFSDEKDNLRINRRTVRR